MSDIKTRALKLYKAPFSLDHGYVWDANGEMFADSVNGARIDPVVVAQVRGWGHIQKLEEPENLQDKVGELIVEALNEKWSGKLEKANKDIQVLAEALSDLLASIGGGKKKCGHEFMCVCAGDKARELANKYKDK